MRRVASILLLLACGCAAQIRYDSRVTSTIGTSGSLQTVIAIPYATTYVCSGTYISTPCTSSTEAVYPTAADAVAGTNAIAQPLVADAYGDITNATGANGGFYYMTGPIYYTSTPPAGSPAGAGSTTVSLPGAGGTITGGAVNPTTLDATAHASQFAGADAGAKINACIVYAQGSSGNGVCDATGLTGTLTSTSTITDNGKPIVLYLPATTITFTLATDNAGIQLTSTTGDTVLGAQGPTGWTLGAGTKIAYAGSGVFWGLALGTAATGDLLGGNVGFISVDLTNAASGSMGVRSAGGRDSFVHDMYVSNVPASGNAYAFNTGQAGCIGCGGQNLVLSRIFDDTATNSSQAATGAGLDIVGTSTALFNTLTLNQVHVNGIHIEYADDVTLTGFTDDGGSYDQDEYFANVKGITQTSAHLEWAATGQGSTNDGITFGTSVTNATISADFGPNGATPTNGFIVGSPTTGLVLQTGLSTTPPSQFYGNLYASNVYDSGNSWALLDGGAPFTSYAGGCFAWSGTASASGTPTSFLCRPTPNHYSFGSTSDGIDGSLSMGSLTIGGGTSITSSSNVVQNGGTSLTSGTPTCGSGTAAVANCTATQLLTGATISAGSITITSATSGSHTFTTAYGSAPTCTASEGTSSPTSLIFGVTSTTTAVTVTLSTSGSGTFTFMCAPPNN